MNDKLMLSQKQLHDSLFDLYIDGGLELMKAGTRGLTRDLIIDFDETDITYDERFRAHK